MSSWTVVEFFETNEVEAVPTSWIYDNQCYWPTLGKQKLFMEIKNCKEPNTHWPLFKVRIFKNGTFDNYLIARQKCRVAEITSDLSSAEEKRKRKKNTIYSSSDEDCSFSENLPPQPKLSLKKNNRKESPKTSLTTLQETFGATAHQNCQIDFSRSFLSNELAQASTSTSECNCCAFHQKKIEEALAAIAKGQSNLRAQILQLRDDLKEETLVKPNEVEDSFFKIFTCPIGTEDDLDKINLYLQSKEHYAKVVRDFSKMGGKDTYDCAKRCLSMLVTNQLASQYSYHGAKQKKAFKALKINEALLDALDLRTESNRKDSESAIQKWLKRANERK